MFCINIFSFCYPGSDYTAVLGRTVTIAPNMESQIVTVSIIDDSLYEQSEDFTGSLSLSAGSTRVTIGPQSVTTATIQDNDGK